jgi:hypothetical protein
VPEGPTGSAAADAAGAWGAVPDRETIMADLVFVLVTLVGFALLALLVRGVERL